VKTLHIDSWVRLKREMQAYYVDPWEEDRAWNSLNKLQQTGSVKDYSEKFLQVIMKVSNVLNEKDKLRIYVERLKDEIRTVVRVGMVDGRYTAFSQVKSAAEALDFELWRSRRNTGTMGITTGWHDMRSATGNASGSAPIHGKAPNYPVPVMHSGKVANCRSRIQKGIALRSCVLIVESPGTWFALVQARARTGEKLMRKTNPPGSPCSK
jgi:hypothetical protein